MKSVVEHCRKGAISDPGSRPQKRGSLVVTHGLCPGFLPYPIDSLENPRTAKLAYGVPGFCVRDTLRPPALAAVDHCASVPSACGGPTLTGVSDIVGDPSMASLRRPDCQCSCPRNSASASHRWAHPRSCAPTHGCRRRPPSPCRSRPGVAGSPRQRPAGAQRAHSGRTAGA